MDTAARKPRSDSLFFQRSDLSFADVCGLEDVKEKLREDVLYPIAHPEISALYNQRIASGILLYGPPGCGKTYLAQALAGEAGWPFINASCGNLIARYAGQTENNVHRVFEKAREYVAVHKRGVILFLDEIDALGASRESLVGGGANQRLVVNTLLSELDGISKNDMVFAVAATNAPWHVDAALKRPGRFDQCVYVPAPEGETRERLFEKFLDGLPLADDVDCRLLAEKSDTYSSADIRELCDAAAEIPYNEAIKTKKARKVAMADFDAVLASMNSSLTEWYALVAQKAESDSFAKIFPELLPNIREVTRETKKEERRQLKGYG